MGWMNPQNHTFKQVRRPTAGGIREMTVHKNDVVCALLEKKKKLFSQMENQEKAVLRV